MSRRRRQPSEVALYLRHIFALLRPGYVVPPPNTHNAEPGPMKSWNASHLTVVIDEGRRSLGSLDDHFERIRERGKYMFTTVLGLLVVVLGVAPRLRGRAPAFMVGWYLGLVCLVLALLGAAAVFAVTAQLGSVDTVLLSQEPADADIVRVLAEAYPKAVRSSAIAVNARFTVLRDVVWFACIGSLIEASTWVLLSVL